MDGWMAGKQTGGWAVWTGAGTPYDDAKHVNEHWRCTCYLQSGWRPCWVEHVSCNECDVTTAMTIMTTTMTTEQDENDDENVKANKNMTMTITATTTTTTERIFECEKRLIFHFVAASHAWMLAEWRNDSTCFACDFPQKNQVNTCAWSWFRFANVTEHEIPVVSYRYFFSIFLVLYSVAIIIWS